MRDTAFAEKRTVPLIRAVDELIDQNECTRRQIFFEGAAGGQ